MEHASGVKQESAATVMTFDNDLKETISQADGKLFMLLTQINNYIEKEGIQAPPSTKIDPVPIPPW